MIKLRPILVFLTLALLSKAYGNPVFKFGEDTKLPTSGKIDDDSLLSVFSRNDSLAEPHLSDMKLRLPALNTERKLKYLAALGSYYFDKEIPDSSIEYYQKGIKTAEKAGNNYYTALFHLRKGINHNIKSEYEAALNELTVAARIASLTDSVSLQNTIVRNTGNVYWGLGIYEKALDSYLHALRISEENQFTKDIASTLNNIGNVYQSINDFTKARDYYSKSLALSEKHNYKMVAAITSNNIGDLLLLEKKYDSALVFFNRSLELSTALGSRFYQGIALFNIGDIHLQNDSLSAAQDYINWSLVRAREAGDRLGIAECYLKLGEIALKRPDLPRAGTYLDSGFAIAQQIGSLRLLDLVFELKTDYFKEKSDFTSAYKTLETRLALKDSIFNQESGKNIAKLEARYREDQRRRQIADLKREKINNRNLYLIGTFSLLIFLVLIYIGFRSSRKKNIILSEQNHEIEKQQQLLIQKNDELIRSQTELEKINLGKDQFLTIISHDLRNPISAMRGFVELIINRFDQLPDEDKKRFLQEVFDSIERVSLLINNILFWVRTQTSGIKIMPVKFDLHKKIQDNIALYRIIAASKKIELINQVPPGFEITGDSNIYDTIFRNLISNSLKFTGPEGKIILDAERKNGKIIITVRDNGIGIEEPNMEDIMKGTSNLSTTGTRHEKGTGLGLNVIRNFTVYMNAELKIDSKPGEGTSVSIIAPEVH